MVNGKAASFNLKTRFEFDCGFELDSLPAIK